MDTITESILNELHSLKDGWSGPESIAPSVGICEDVKKLLRILKPKSSKNFDLWGDDSGAITFFGILVVMYCCQLTFMVMAKHVVLILPVKEESLNMEILIFLITN